MTEIASKIAIYQKESCVTQKDDRLSKRYYVSIFENNNNNEEKKKPIHFDTGLSSLSPEIERIGMIFMTVVPNNKLRCLNIYHKKHTYLQRI